MENKKNIMEKEKISVLAKNEQLRADLLRAISHDLRTPLCSISGNADMLLNSGERLDDITKHQIYTDIYDDSEWLINIVENLLFRHQNRNPLQPYAILQFLPRNSKVHSLPDD